MFKSNVNPMFRSKFAEDIFNQKYAHEGAETWATLARTLVTDVCVGRLSKDEQDTLTKYITDLKFIPGGRYLYYAGRTAKFFNNCFDADTKLLTDRGWVRFADVVGQTVNVLSPVDGQFRPAEMHAHGVQPVQKITFANVRGKSTKTWTVVATPNHKWALKKGGSTEALKVGDVVPANQFKAMCQEPEAFLHGFVFGDGALENVRGDGQRTYRLRLCGDKAALETNFIDLEGVTKYRDIEGDPFLRIRTMRSLKELPVGASVSYIIGFIKGWLAADGHSSTVNMLHTINEDALDFFIENAPLAGLVVTGAKRVETKPSNFGERKPLHYVNWTYGSQFQGFKVVEIEPLGEREVFCPFEPVYNRIVIDHGIDTYQCFLLRAEEDTREDWADLSWKSESCLMTGGGIGIDYSVYRPKGSPLGRTGGLASGPLPKMEMINEIGRRVMQGGSRRSAIYASLNWQHGDIEDFLTIKDWKRYKVPGTDLTLFDLKQLDFNWPAPLDMTNISVNYDTTWLLNYWKTGDVGEVFKKNVAEALKTAEPGFSFNFFDKERETLRNAPVSANTRVLTDNGYMFIKDIVDQLVVVWTGKQWAPTTFRKTKSMVPVVRVEMTNGLHIDADPEHEFFVFQESGSLRKVPAGELKFGDRLLSRGPGECPNDQVSVVSVSSFGIEDVFCCDVGVEEHSFMAEGVIISNCTEVTSEDDSDVCNLGSINMGRVESIAEFQEIVALATKFLLAGTTKADLPYDKVYRVREKNRRLGLGLMGMHEWLIQRGSRYEVTPELHRWLMVYKAVSDKVAFDTADRWGVNRPVGRRAIAPTGTIGILAGTTTGVEPLFAVAYKRRYLKDGTDWHYQYVVDSAAQELIDFYGADPDKIESALDLAADYERRMAFQADVQDYVDQSISSTINLPSYGTELNNDWTVDAFANTLAKYAHRLRGFTVYPDGARGGQPLTAVPYSEAKEKLGQVFKEAVQTHDICSISGKGGTCGI